MTRTLLSLMLTTAAVGCDRSLQWAPQLVQQVSGTQALLQAVSVVNDTIVWVSGHEGSYARTIDGGVTWEAARVPGADTLQFRDVHAVDAEIAYLLGAGPGDMSRIYKTEDGGTSWSLQFVNNDPHAFYDCFDFWDAHNGIAFSDAVDGAFVILRTEDGGAHWTQVSDSALPQAQTGEGSFAASGTCVTVGGERFAWIGTGAADTARILSSSDTGHSWLATLTPIRGGPAAGLASIVFLDTLTGWAFGGNIGEPDVHVDNAAGTLDGGISWHLVSPTLFSGAVYGAAVVPGAPSVTLAAVSPQGLDYSTDGGVTWGSLDTLSYWAVGFASPFAGWAVGPTGRIAKIILYVEQSR